MAAGQHAQRVRSQPRALLAAIPGLKLEELPEGAICCGSAGIYNLVEPETAHELGDRKAQHIAAVQPDAVATGNPACQLQLRAALDRKGKNGGATHHSDSGRLNPELWRKHGTVRAGWKSWTSVTYAQILAASSPTASLVRLADNTAKWGGLFPDE